MRAKIGERAGAMDNLSAWRQLDGADADSAAAAAVNHANMLAEIKRLRIKVNDMMGILRGELPRATFERIKNRFNLALDNEKKWKGEIE